MNRGRFGHRTRSICNLARQEAASDRHPDFSDVPTDAELKINVALPIQTPAEMATFRERDFESNGAIIKAANIKLE